MFVLLRSIRNFEAHWLISSYDIFKCEIQQQRLKKIGSYRAEFSLVYFLLFCFVLIEITLH